MQVESEFWGVTCSVIFHCSVSVVTDMQYVGDLASSDVSPHSCASYSARTLLLLWLPSIFG